ncbi:MAG: phosphatase [bacterium]|nr:MAG: phosphatase [bacterium]KAF0147659.1 MAG: phosphatase [bacterium]KAF0166746.1 MAG: phosphatase [bacterium]TXT19151.1 MAG: phosphatase [bacterium]
MLFMAPPATSRAAWSGWLALAILLPWSLALLVLVAGARWVCPDGVCAVPAFDRAGLVLAGGWRDPVLDTAMAAVTWLGSLFVLLPLAAWAAWRLAHTGRSRQAVFLLAALLGASALAHAAKLWVARPRPDLFPALVTMPADLSYPSAHSMQAAALALALLLVAPAGRGRAPLAVMLAGTVALVAASRIHLQVHFPSDVFAGVLVAAGWVLGLRALLLGRTAARPRFGEAT